MNRTISTATQFVALVAVVVLIMAQLAAVLVPGAAQAQSNPVITEVATGDRGGFAGWTTTFDNGRAIHIRRGIYVKTAPAVGIVQHYTENQSCFVICWTNSTSFTDVVGNSYIGY